MADNSAKTFVSHRLPLAIALRDWGALVIVAVPDGDGVLDIEANGFSCERLFVQRRGMSLVGELCFIVQMVRLFQRLRPNIAHLRTPKLWTSGAIAARIAGVPALVSHITGIGFARDSSSLRARLALVSIGILGHIAFRHPRQRVIVQNRDDVRQIARLGCPEPKIRLVRGSGVDSEALRPTPMPQGIPLIVLPARMLANKGVREFVAAATQLRATGVQARFVLVGDSDPGNPSAIECAELKRWHAIGDIEWWGFRRNMPEVYSQSSIVCLPSYGEGLPKALLEAMACGRPVVTTRVAGCKEPVIDGVTGIIVPPRDVDSLAGALKELITDLSRCERMGAAGRRHLEMNFSLPVVLRQTIAVFEEVATPPARR